MVDIDLPISSESTPLFNYSHPTINSVKLQHTSPNDIINYVINKVKYHPHITQFYPWETLEKGYGDCDDIAILAVTLLRKYGYKSTVVTGYILSTKETIEFNVKEKQIKLKFKGVFPHAWIVYEEHGKLLYSDPIVKRYMVYLSLYIYSSYEEFLRELSQIGISNTYLILEVDLLYSMIVSYIFIFIYILAIILLFKLLHKA